MEAQANSKNIYSVPLKTIDGKATTLESYKGKTLLIVNTASQCGYTPQYKGLEALYEKYKSKGLVVLGFPSNDFGAQEPGSNVEIKSFCEKNFGVTFPLFEKKPVKGAEKQALFDLLVNQTTPKEEVAWNFEKFLVSKDGKVVGHFKSSVKPDDKQLIDSIEKSL